MGDGISALREAKRYVEEACRLHSMANVAVRTDNDWLLCQGKLLGCNYGRGILWAAYPAPVWRSEMVELGPGSQVGFRFPSEDRRVTFMGTVLKIRELRRGLGKKGAIEVAIPEEISCENLRQSYRVQIDPENAYKMVLWDTSMRQLTDPADAPSMYAAKVIDLSIGGAAISELDADPGWDVGSHVGLELQPPAGESLLLMAQIRRITRLRGKGVTYGMAFIGAETPRKTFAAQETLSRMVSQQQRVQLEQRIKTA